MLFCGLFAVGENISATSDTYQKSFVTRPREGFMVNTLASEIAIVQHTLFAGQVEDARDSRLAMHFNRTKMCQTVGTFDENKNASFGLRCTTGAQLVPKRLFLP